MVALARLSMTAARGFGMAGAGLAERRDTRRPVAGIGALLEMKLRIKRPPDSMGESASIVVPHSGVPQ